MKQEEIQGGMKEDGQTESEREWENKLKRMMTALSTSFVVRGRDSAPTSHIEDHPQATHMLRVTENPSTCTRLSCVYLSAHQ